MSKKINVRRLSIRFKILIPSIIINILVCSAIGFVLYQNTKDEMISMAMEETFVLTKIISEQIEGDLLEDMEPGDEETERYIKVADTLRMFNSSGTLKYLSTLYLGEDDKVYYGVDYDNNPDTYCPIGLEYEADNSIVKKVLETGEPYVENEIYMDEKYGAMISAYSPIYNSDNEVVAVLEGDYNAQIILDKMASKVIRNVIVSTLSGIVIFSVILIILIGRINKSIRKVNETVCELVSNEGDLTKKLDVKTGDELEVIANHVNELLEYFHKMMIVIADNSIKLKSSSGKVLENIRIVNDSVTDVSAMSEEISASMEETSASVLEIEESVGFMAVSASEILEKATSGSSLASEISIRAEKLSTGSAEESKNAEKMMVDIGEVLTEKIEESKSVEKIRELTNEIIGISDQTNLLSLNASIEAARAGDAGRGFAVVAEEISKLATSSAKVAEQIQRANEEVIAAVNDLANESEKMLQFNKETSVKCFRHLMETGDLYKEDSNKIKKIMEMFVDQSKFIDSEVKEIKENVKAVSIAAEESAKGISEVADMTNKLTISMDIINSEANENIKISGSLGEEVDKFKL